MTAKKGRGGLSKRTLSLNSDAAPYFDLGCKGGDFEGGMKYIIDHGEEDYPYLAEDSKCNHKKASHRVILHDIFPLLQDNETRNAMSLAGTSGTSGLGNFSKAHKAQRKERQTPLTKNSATADLRTEETTGEPASNCNFALT